MLSVRDPSGRAAPRVSVVVITYNHERWVREALDSIFAQGHPPDRLQVIVVDNGSQDSTPEILAEYADRIELLLLDGGPLNEAVNLGHRRVRGDYFTGLSGDDAWTPNRLGPMLDVLERRPEVGLVYGDMEVIGPDSAPLHPSWRQAHGLPVHEGRMLGRLLERNLVFGPAVLMRSSLRPALLPVPELAAWEDWWFASTVARIAEIAYLPIPVTRYRRHSAALSNVDSPEREVAFLREDLRFRGWLLRTVTAKDATPEELTTAILAQIEGVLRLAELVGKPPVSVMRVGALERRQAHGARKRAQAAASTAERMAWLARAVAYDPSDARISREFSRAATAAEEDGTRRAPEPVDPDLVLTDAYEHVALALGEELLAAPELVADHFRAAAGRPPATLAVFGPGADQRALTAVIEAALEETGADCDVVLLDLPDSPSVRAALATRATELLTAGAAAGWPWDGIGYRAAAGEPVPAV